MSKQKKKPTAKLSSKSAKAKSNPGGLTPRQMLDLPIGEARMLATQDDFNRLRESAEWKKEIADSKAALAKLIEGDSAGGKAALADFRQSTENHFRKIDPAFRYDDARSWKRVEGIISLAFSKPVDNVLDMTSEQLAGLIDALAKHKTAEAESKHDWKEYTAQGAATYLGVRAESVTRWNRQDKPWIEKAKHGWYRIDFAHSFIVTKIAKNQVADSKRKK